MKRVISLVLSLVMILSMVPAIGMTAGAAEYTVVDKIPATIDTSKSTDGWGGCPVGEWVPMFEGGVPAGTWPAWDETHYAEIVADGYGDVGALHMVSDGGKNTAVSFNAGMTVGQSYTLTLWAKGTSNSGCVLRIFANQDTIIINTAQDLGADWTQYQVTITATNNGVLTLRAADWGKSDLYIDNVSLVGANGVDLLAGYGDFYTLGEVVKDSDVTNELTETGYLDSSKSASSYGATEKIWVPMYPSGTPEGTWSAWDAEHYAEVVANGFADAGSLHIVSAAGKNTGLAINAGMIAGQTYTLSLWAKGTAQSQSLFSYANGDAVIIETPEALSNEWKQFTVTFTANLSQLNLCCRDWGSNDVYVDNITLTDADGNELLGCAGNFCHKVVVDAAVAATCTTSGKTEGKHCSVCNVVFVAQTQIPASGHSYGPTGNDGHAYCANCGACKQWMDESLLDATTGYSPWGAPAGKWVPMFGTADGQPDGSAFHAWSDTYFAQIVEDGNKDAGALHIKSTSTSTIAVAINLGMTVGETYTLGMWVKGSTTNPNKVLSLYGNGDGTIIGAVEYSADGVVASTSISDQWTYVERTFTANLNQLNLWAANWGDNDIFIDNITVKNASGVDLMAGYGDFYTEFDPDLTVTTITLDTSKLDDLYGAPTDEWVPFSPWANYQDTYPAWDADHYAEIVADGKNDAGSLHLVSAGGKNAGVVINPGMIAGQTYTLGMWVKGTAASNKMLALYGNGDVTLIGNPEYCGEVNLATVPASWTYIERNITASVSCLAIFAADWGTSDLYIDNITLTDAAGTDLLAGNGNFCKIAEEEPEAPVEPEVEGLGVIDEELKRAYRWYWNGMRYTQTDYSTVNISGFGADDPGSLHIWQSTTGSSDVLLGLVNTMATDLDNGSYTLSLNVKGTFSNITETFTIYPAYCNDDQMRALSIPKKLQEVTGVTPNADGMYVVDQWTNLTWELPTSPAGDGNGFMYLAMMFSKYNNTCEYYIDNVQVFDPNGNDMLGGAGSFMDSGSEYWPIILPAEGAEILNSNTMYYQVSAGESNVSVSNHVESGITCGDQNFTVTHNGVTQSASNKNVTMQMAPAAEGDPIVFAITSTASSVDVPSGVFEMMQRAGEFNIYDVTVTALSCIHSYSDWNVTAAPTYTAAGSQSKTCALCGEVVTEEIPVLANPVSGWNISLGDDIGVNFVMALAETDVVAVTVNGKAVDCSVTDGKFSVKVAAAQMMDEIAISVNGLPLANTYSVRAYADKILADEDQSACHALVKNMLVYGGAAQTYFGYNSANLASDGIKVDAVAPTGEGAIAVSGSVSGIQLYGATLVTRNKIAVRIYFTGDLSAATVTANGDTVKAVKKGDLYYVEVADINPQNLGEDVTVVVSDGVNNLSVGYSPLDYMIRMYEKGDASLRVLIQALYGYYQAAAAYTA